MKINCKDCNKEINVAPNRVKVQKFCKKCYCKRLKGKGNPRWKGSKICVTCGKERKRSKKGQCAGCFKRSLPGKAVCIICGGQLSIWKNSKNYDTGICQKCYIKDKTRVWNSELSEEDREDRERRRNRHEYHIWRKAVYERDCYTCQRCKKRKGGYICAHHIENYTTNKEKRFDLDNGITFCGDCHKEFHKKYGSKNNNYIQLTDFLNK